MNFKDLKKELFYLRKAFFSHEQGFKYFIEKYKGAPRILTGEVVLETPVTNANLSMHFLSSNSDLVMLCWSLFSFYNHSKIIGKLYVHDDGSFINRDYKVLHRLFPSISIVDTEKFLLTYKDAISKYPSIQEYRSSQISMVWRKKLIDPYFTGVENWKLILDSDVLWFANPQEILDAISEEKNSSYMMSLAPGYPVKFKDGTRLNSQLAQYNSGIVLYKQDNLNLSKLSNYLKLVDLNDLENSHFIEQAGYASALENLNALPQEKYRIKGELGYNTVAKHYTSPRRVLFFTEGVPALSANIS